MRTRSEMSIGERDIEFYLSCVEGDTRRLVNCPMAQEPYWKARRDAAQRVIDALDTYLKLCLVQSAEG